MFVCEAGDSRIWLQAELSSEFARVCSFISMSATHAATRLPFMDNAPAWTYTHGIVIVVHMHGTIIP